MALGDLFTPARNPMGVDVGPCLFYSQLSYRRRLIKDIIFAPISFVIFLVGLSRMPHPGWTIALLVFGWAPMAALLIARDYYMWQNYER